MNTPTPEVDVRAAQDGFEAASAVYADARIARAAARKAYTVAADAAKVARAAAADADGILSRAVSAAYVAAQNEVVAS